MERTTRRRTTSERVEEVDETEATASTENDVDAEAEAMLDEIDRVLEETEVIQRGAQTMIDLDDEDDYEDDDEWDDEAIAKALWNLGLFAPIDLSDWIREDLSGNCPFCGCNPCIGWTLS